MNGVIQRGTSCSALTARTNPGEDTPSIGPGQTSNASMFTPAVFRRSDFNRQNIPRRGELVQLDKSAKYGYFK